MKKMKRLFAVLLALAMVLGMSVVTFAAPGDESSDPVITVKNVHESATVTYAQIIEPDSTQVTGWAFAKKDPDTVTDQAANFIKAIKADTANTNKSEQDIIAGLLIYQHGEIKSGEEATAEDKFLATVEGSAATITATLLQNAFAAVTPPDTNTAASSDADYTIPITKAGIYVIKVENQIVREDSNDATSKITSQINYSPMAAFVAFQYNPDGTAAALQSVDVTAKKQDLVLTKEDNEEDKVVAVNDIVTYTIRTTVPYIPTDVTDDKVYFNIVDKIKGAQYVVNKDLSDGPCPVIAEDDLASAAKTDIPVTVKLAGETFSGITTAAWQTAEGYDGSFSLALGDIAEDRNNAGKALEITYKAYVQKTVVDNKANTEVKTKNDQEIPDKGPEDEDKIYTASLKMTKKDAEDQSITLKGAKFVVYYENNGTTYYAVTKKAEESENVDYIVTGWTETKPEGDANLLITKDDGTVTVKGFENDEDRVYKFEEVEAPDGYSLNTAPAELEKWSDIESDIENEKVGEYSLLDTKLSALPSTGGIGTTIFTIAGCLIMIAAAGLFFATRRKSAK